MKYNFCYLCGYKKEGKLQSFKILSPDLKTVTLKVCEEHMKDFTKDEMENCLQEDFSNNFKIGK